MNQKEFREVYQRYFSELCCFLSRYTPDREQIKDIVQGVFVKLLDEEPGQIRNLRQWLYFSARNALLNVLRDNRNRKILLEDFALCFTPPVESPDREEEVSASRAEVVRRAIDTLPEKCREIFIMAKRQGMSYHDIALSKGISIKTVEAQMGIALRRIREFCQASAGRKEAL